MMKQIFIVIIICYLLACENKKQNTNQEINKDIGEIQIKKQPYQKEEFVYSIKNIKDKYKNIKIILEKDSLKILDLEFQLMICSSEIIKRKKHIKDYWGIGNSREIKKKLWNGLGFQLTDSIEVIENVKSELSREGCQFPFYEMFISNNFLFFYDENYYCFVPKEVEESLINIDCSKEKIIHFSYLSEYRFDYKADNSTETPLIAQKMENIKVDICNDTLIINNKYKASFTRKKLSFDRFFGENKGSWVEKKLSERFEENRIYIKKDSISFLQIDLPTYNDFSFSNYSMRGTIIYEQGYLCLIHNEKVIGWFRDDKFYMNEYNSNNLPFDYINYAKNEYTTGGEDYKFLDPYNERKLINLLSYQLKQKNEETYGVLCFYLPNYKFNIIESSIKNGNRILTIEKKTNKIIDHLDIIMKDNEFWQEKNFKINKDLSIILYENKLGGKIELESEVYDSSLEFREILKSTPYKKYQIQEDGRIIEL